MTSGKPFVITIVGPESSGKTTLASQLSELFGCPRVPEYAREYLGRIDRPYDEKDLALIAEGQLAGIMEGMSSLQSSVGSEQSSVGSGQTSVGSLLPPGHLAFPPSRFPFPPSPLKGVKSVQEERFVQILISTLQDESSGISSKNILIVDGGMMTLRLWARIKFGIKIDVVEEAMNDDVTSLYLLCRPTIPWEPDPLREAPMLLDRVWIYNQYLKEVVESNSAFHFYDASSESE